VVKPWALLLVLVVALPLALGVAGLPPHGDADAPIHTHVGRRYLERGLAETGMRNQVTAVLLNYRGFDTFIEVSVIFTALVAVLTLPRGAGAGAAGAGADGARGAPSASEASPAPIPASPIVFFVVRLLAPFIAVFALATLFRGHVTPGGGFQAAAVFGALFIALGLVLGRERAARLVPTTAGPWLQGVAPLAFAVVAWFGWRLTGAFLGVPTDPAAHGVQEAMGFVLEGAIALGGAVILARLFLSMEA
jgi:multicomponent Na+:H+ antiporter subunit B